MYSRPLLAVAAAVRHDNLFRHSRRNRLCAAAVAEAHEAVFRGAVLRDILCRL